MTKVIVYSTPSCMACRSTQTALDKAEIAFEKIDLAEDEVALARLRENGYYAAPVVEVYNEDALADVWVGFRPDKISQLSN